MIIVEQPLVYEQTFILEKRSKQISELQCWHLLLPRKIKKINFFSNVRVYRSNSFDSNKIKQKIVDAHMQYGIISVARIHS